jgi:hypothetical protein
MKNLLLSLFIAFSLFAEAQVSKLIDAGGSAVVTKASANYAKVFKRKRGTVTEFVWYTTDANGNKLSRGGQVKGTSIYSTLATAEVAIPLGYTLVAGGGGGTVNGDFLVQFTKGMTNDVSYQYDKPTFISIYNNNETFERLLITVTNDYKLVLTINTVGFADAAENMRFKVDVDATTDFTGWMTKAELETKDFSALKGHDILVVMGHKPNANLPINVIYTWVHLKGDNTSNLPSFFKRTSPLVRLPQAPYSFPDFTSPLATKLNIMQFQQLNNSFTNVSSNYLSKGFNIATSNTLSKSYVGNYDDWAYNNGAMRLSSYDAYKLNYQNANGGANPPYANAFEYNVNWVKTHTIQELFQYFNNEVISPTNGRGFVFLDWEWVYNYGLTDQDFVNKIGTLFREFHNRNPNTVLTSYVNADPANIKYNITLSDADVAINNLKYTQTKEQVAAGFYSKTVNYLNVDNGDYLRNLDGSVQTGNMGQYIEPVVKLDMHNINNTTLYSAINEFEVASNIGFKPLAFLWGLNEGLPFESDWNAYAKYFRSDNGRLYQKQVKTPVPASYMWNTVLMSNFFGRGAWIWDDPTPFLEGFNYWQFAFDIGNSSLRIEDNTSAAQNFGIMHYASQAYDYATWAIQRMIHNKDIIDNTQAITKPEYSIDNGVTYKTGNNLLPASAEKNKLPIVRLKKHATLNEYVIFAVNHHLKTWETQTLKVKVADKIITVTLNGQFAIFERIK